ncbi:hypothetical protein KOR42_06110 [Thalassoglobus neptunius]|uniref:Phage major tail protein 2 n=1 Tax=Thalassoglobus neptunius TaxID=1938619 RepID=A0A5C5X4U2_9PLAN|nr:hypothetical protein [Thalassoglobus neptunius]TWT57253.1 hypothetical protein KOR42_06110 [Thalassoglobus neptunius]
MTVYAGVDSILQVTIAASLTTIAGIRDIEFDPGEVELMEIDDLASDYVDRAPTGRAGGGTVTAECFWDPANAQMQALHTLWNTPAEEDFSITWSTTTESIAFKGILTKIPISATRTDPITTALEVAVSQRPVLNES